MPFSSKAQMRASFAGALGPEIKRKAKMWAKETPDIKGLPEHVKLKTGMRRIRVRVNKKLI